MNYMNYARGGCWSEWFQLKLLKKIVQSLFHSHENDPNILDELENPEMNSEWFFLFYFLYQ